jgi:hypothetical protein
MSKQLGTGAVVGILAVVVVVLGLVAWRMFTPAGGGGATGQNTQQNIEQDMRQMQGGGAPGTAMPSPR